MGQIGASLTDLLQWECDDYVNAVIFHRLKQDESWEMVRWLSYYSVVAMNGSKITIKDIAMPTDSFKESEPIKKAKWRKLI